MQLRNVNKQLAEAKAKEKEAKDPGEGSQGSQVMADELISSGDQALRASRAMHLSQIDKKHCLLG